MRILGIDPGSRLTGFGCIELKGPQIRHIRSGTLRLALAERGFEDRLVALYDELTELIEDLMPEILVIEKVFFAKNAVSALKLGQARGVVLLCGAKNGLKIFEYNPTEVKAAIVGHGRADKEAVSRMVTLITGARDFATHDASDALALALCHAHNHKSPLRRIEASLK